VNYLPLVSLLLLGLIVTKTSSLTKVISEFTGVKNKLTRLSFFPIKDAKFRN